MKVADTSFLVAFFDEDDARSEEAAARLATTQPVVVSPEVLVETLGVLKAKGGRSVAAGALDDLMRLENLEWSTECNPVGAHAIYRAEPALSYVDAAVVELSVRLGADLLTYDLAQQRAAKRRARQAPS